MRRQTFRAGHTLCLAVVFSTTDTGYGSQAVATRKEGLRLVGFIFFLTRLWTIERVSPRCRPHKTGVSVYEYPPGNDKHLLRAVHKTTTGDTMPIGSRREGDVFLL